MKKEKKTFFFVSVTKIMSFQVFFLKEAMLTEFLTSIAELFQKTVWMRFQFDREAREQSIVFDAWIASFCLACDQSTVNSGTVVLESLESCRLWSQVYK